MIDFDPAKDEINRRKHGIYLARAIEIDLGTAVIRIDDRRDYGEPRWRAYAMLEGKLHMLAFTLRHGGVRVISLRRANARETKRYG
ncbi:MAG: BrnT family toxin [Brevundimonas sp.]|jgi:uncharacterized DUF497 family protein|uniref:BrnT family toxin n=1 Tax=Brevundimonas sp. TaxID=1871086 RepID=UPI0022C9E0B2|nr:BrnT family toxin [Brevundimonas sp.]